MHLLHAEAVQLAPAERLERAFKCAAELGVPRLVDAAELIAQKVPCDPTGGRVSVGVGEPFTAAMPLPINDAINSASSRDRAEGGVCTGRVLMVLDVTVLHKRASEGVNVRLRVHVCVRPCVHCARQCARACEQGMCVHASVCACALGCVLACVSVHERACVRAYISVCVCVCACVRQCVRAFVRSCVRH